MSYSPEYLAYLASPEWRERREQALASADYQCEAWVAPFGDSLVGSFGWRCPEVEDLSVHHWTYERLGCELDEDLEVLCPEHHDEADQLRRMGVAA